MVLFDHFWRFLPFVHTLTILAVFWPAASLAFFLGYGLHLFMDSFTKEGIVPFWPYNKRSSGFLRTGSLSETSFFLVLVLIDIALLFVLFGNFF